MVILFLVIYGLDINDEDSKEYANTINDATIVLIFLTSIVNVILSVLVCTDQSPNHSHEIP